MKVGEVMTRYVEFIDPEATVCEAATMMGELEVGALPVGTAEALEGVITDRDILYRVVAKCLDNAAVRVRDIVSRPVIGCGVDDSVQAAMDLMSAHHVRRLAVRDRGGKVVGWVTLADLARQLLVGSDALQGALRELSEEAA